MENLNKIYKLSSDKVMTLAELKEDRMYEKIPEDKIGYYVNSTIEIGEKAAESILNEYQGKDIFQICKEKEIKININTEEYKFEVIKLRGKYNKNKQEIDLYDKSMKNMMKNFQNVKIGKILSYSELKKILVTHELYHYLEYEEIGATEEKLSMINVLKFPFRRTKSQIIKTSDMSAHIFCKKLLNLAYHPKLIDYYYFIGKGYIDFQFLENYLNELDNFIKERNI